MSKAPNKAAAFLQALETNAATAAEPSPPPRPAKAAVANDPRPAQPRPSGRTGLKHIGGYFDRVDVEKFAVLRARLGLDNSELIKLAVEELYRKHEAKRAFGDA
jgi:hypothetical protein